MFVADLGIRVGSDAVRVAKDRLDQMRRSGRGAEEAVDDLGSTSRRSMSGIALLTRGVVGLAAAAGGLSLGAQFVGQGRETSKALAEVSTLIEGTAEQQRDLTDASEDFVRQFGGSVAGQLQAYYQTISAGASSVAEATETMTQANKLAKGGVTDIGTAVDGLTSVLNAYGDSVEGAEAVSDAMFVAMKAGKTTIGELSAGLGAVAPLAVNAGVGFDELLASVAALTKGGIGTSEAMTGMRAILSSVVKPSQEASEVAEALGIDFSAAALKSMGFTEFMDQLVQKTGGSTEALAMLFGGVEALVPVLALAGQAGEDFDTIMVDMATKAGQTDIAVDKVASSLDDRLSVALSRFTVYGNQAGTMLLNVLVPAMEGVGNTIDFVVVNWETIGTTMAVMATTQIPAVVGGLASVVAAMYSAATASGVLGAALAIAGGPLGILLGLVAGAAAYFLVFRDNASEAETAAYSASDGTAALNIALGTFYSTAAPSAGKAAISLANENYKLAQSALAAAEAEMAKAKALQETRLSEAPDWIKQAVDGGAVIPEVTAATERLAKTRAAVDEAKRAMNRAARAVTGSEFSMSRVTLPKPEDVKVDTSAIEDLINKLKETGTGGGAAGGGAANGATGALNELEKAAESVFMDTRTPLEKYNIALGELQQLLKAGVIDTETFRRAQEQLKDELRSSDEGWQKTEEGIKKLSSSLTDVLMKQKTLSDFFRESIANMAKTLIDSGLQKLIGNLIDSIGSRKGGGGLGSLIGKFLQSFEGGGSTPSGSRTGGIDGRGGMLAMVHPDEEVYDKRRGGGSGSGDRVVSTVVQVQAVAGEMFDLRVLDSASRLDSKRAVDQRRNLQKVTSDIQFRGIG